MSKISVRVIPEDMSEHVADPDIMFAEDRKFVCVSMMKERGGVGGTQSHKKVLGDVATQGKILERQCREQRIDAVKLSQKPTCRQTSSFQRGCIPSYDKVMSKKDALVLSRQHHVDGKKQYNQPFEEGERINRAARAAFAQGFATKNSWLNSENTRKGAAFLEDINFRMGSTW